jgi:hypothetical protein
MTGAWVVVLEEPHHVYGPFDDEALAAEFAGFLSQEVDPAHVEPLRSPTAELLAFEKSTRLARS